MKSTLYDDFNFWKKKKELVQNLLGMVLAMEWDLKVHKTRKKEISRKVNGN